MPSLETCIAENLARVHSRVADAARRSGREARDVRVIAVTKYVGDREVEALFEAGCRDFGESRPQELWRKVEAFKVFSPADKRTQSDAAEGEQEEEKKQKDKENGQVDRRAYDISWHLIGHMQRNKVRRTLPMVQWIHSADSQRLLQSLEKQAGELGCQPNVLLEVNISGDQAKHGFEPGELEPLLPQLADLRHLRIRGLMGMAALTEDDDVAQRNFAELRKLRDQLQAAAPASIGLDELSMGMSGDFEAAIAAGATMVRIGSAFFKGVV